MTGSHVLVMAKAPVPGRVKTRLCPPLTHAEAAQLAQAALADTLDAVSASGAQRPMLALDGEPGEWLPSGFAVFAQSGRTFNERLAHAWSVAGGTGVQIGMDTPQVTPALLDDALARLDGPGVDAVLGHAEDGGWWIIGARQAHPRMFDGIPMSSPGTGAAQQRRLAELGLDYRLLPQLRDVDTVADARAVRDASPHGRFAATVDALAAIGDRSCGSS